MSPACGLIPSTHQVGPYVHLWLTFWRRCLAQLDVFYTIYKYNGITLLPNRTTLLVCRHQPSVHHVTLHQVSTVCNYSTQQERIRPNLSAWKSLLLNLEPKCIIDSHWLHATAKLVTKQWSLCVKGTDFEMITHELEICDHKQTVTLVPLSHLAVSPTKLTCGGGGSPS